MYCTRVKHTKNTSTSNNQPYHSHTQRCTPFYTQSSTRAQNTPLHTTKHPHSSLSYHKNTARNPYTHIKSIMKKHS